MKRYLLGTTALVAAGMLMQTGTANAQAKAQPIQITIGGFVSEHITYTSQDDRAARNDVSAANPQGSGRVLRFDTHSDNEIHFQGRTTLANGITISLRVEFEGNTSGDTVDESWVALEGMFGRFEMGQLNNVHYRMQVKPIDAFTRGIMDEGNIATNWFQNTAASGNGIAANDTLINTTVSRFRDNDSDKINYYTPRWGGFQAGLSYMPDSSQDTAAPTAQDTAYTRGFAIAANFIRTFGAFDVAAYGGYMQWNGPTLAGGAGAPDPSQYSFGLRLGYAGFTLGASYGKLEDGRSGAAGTAAASAAGTGAQKAEGKAYNIGASYTWGPALISLGYFEGKNNDSPTAPGADLGDDKFSLAALSGRYTLGPGITVEASLFTFKLSGNTPGTTLDDNKGSGAIVGLVLQF